MNPTNQLNPGDLGIKSGIIAGRILKFLNDHGHLKNIDQYPQEILLRIALSSLILEELTLKDLEFKDINESN